MTTLQLFACIGMIVGCFILLRLKPIEFTDAVMGRLTSRPKSLKDEINEATQRKKPSFLRREIMEAQDILALTGRSGRFSLICACSLLLFATGAAFAIMLQNVFAGVLFAQADCSHPRGQGTVDVIVTGTAGEATVGLLEAVREAVDKIAGPYDNILVKSSVTIPQDIEVVITTVDSLSDEEIIRKVESVLTELLAVRKGRKLYELLRSDVNYAIRSGYTASTNAEIITPAQDVRLDKNKVITLGAVTVTVRRE